MGWTYDLASNILTKTGYQYDGGNRRTHTQNGVTNYYYSGAGNRLYSQGKRI